MRGCDVPGCDSAATRKGMCQMHRRRVTQGRPANAPSRRRSAGFTWEEWLWGHIDRSGGPDACWEWTGNREPTGYGIGSWNGTRFRAHRAAWEFAHRQAIPDGLVLRHRCDNPPCCNPAHLVPGTDADNMLDRIQRQPEGLVLTSSRRRYSLETVNAIRADYAAGARQAALVERYGVSRSQVSRIVRGESWGLLTTQKESA